MPPSELHATFLPDHASPADGRLLFFGGAHPRAAVAELGLPPGDPVDAELYLDGELQEVEGVAMPVRPVLPALTRIASRPDITESVAIWARIANAVDDDKFDDLDRIAGELPAEGHSVPHSEGHVWTAKALVGAFVESFTELLRSDSGLNLRLITAQHSDPGPIRVNAELRRYQAHGIAWLEAAAEGGAGVILADDMGLGKTLQSIGLLVRRAGNAPHLVVCPTSLVGNWQREIARFAPQLTVHLHHGPNRTRHPAPLHDADVIVTSYSIALRDVKLLRNIAFDTIVIDEAQAIKNHRSRTAGAVRDLTGRVRVALTGTPVENHLAELWSISEFVNPGLLGGQTDFKRRFADPIEIGRDPVSAATLRARIDPVVLRRMKEDVAADLPPKIEAVVACTMTDEQSGLYKEAIREAFDEGLGDGITRRGRVLKLLTRLKQICNHPAQYVGEGDGGLAERSGKLDRVTEMLAEVVDEGAKALIFTQYRQMGELLSRHLHAELGVAAPFLHGGLDQPARDKLVDGFQTSEGPDILLVSLRAGGTGLNLTGASHVVHYDRWWNPAVEDQATDRAHRIGQTRTVHVHKLVTAGSLEERVDELLARKRAIADAVVGSGEDWLGELDDSQLRKLIELDDAGGPL
ncbi:DEAD/DEAH box helicase [Glycomyces harbinensis]|uniref:Helicase conserved C-terminal domain-containing protein n=1 Tax=Glycomyces harbinensis TaxID=58114 RepID=A0A1G6RLY1_9ACTN|nr:DEAD/DEAH box helicase [Glycomyces harbinensis]SDD05364.1 Helicase conserved C-terminal domain-containing protein [Glycomyces harbinensis]